MLSVWMLRSNCHALSCISTSLPVAAQWSGEMVQFTMKLFLPRAALHFLTILYLWRDQVSAQILTGSVPAVFYSGSCWLGFCLFFGIPPLFPLNQSWVTGWCFILISGFGTIGQLPIWWEMLHFQDYSVNNHLLRAFFPPFPSQSSLELFSLLLAPSTIVCITFAQCQAANMVMCIFPWPSSKSCLLSGVAKSHGWAVQVEEREKLTKPKPCIYCLTTWSIVWKEAFLNL